MAQLYDRAQLLAEVWAEPLTVVARRYGLSDVSVAKLCTRLNIPRPPQGYWAKRAAGKPVPAIPALLAYTGAPSALRRPARPATPDSPTPVDPRLAVEARADNRIWQAWHPVVEAAQTSLQRPRIDARGLPQTTAGTLDISVSPALLSRTLSVANALLRALEVRGYTLTPGRQRIEVRVLGIALTLRFYEPTHRLDYQPTATERAEAAAGEAGYWPKWQFQPTGKLQVIVSDAFGGKVSDSNARTVEDQLNHVIVLMVTRAVDILQREERYAVEAAEREAVRQALAHASKRKRWIGRDWPCWKTRHYVGSAPHVYGSTSRRWNNAKVTTSMPNNGHCWSGAEAWRISWIRSRPVPRLSWMKTVRYRLDESTPMTDLPQSLPNEPREVSAFAQLVQRKQAPLEHLISGVGYAAKGPSGRRASNPRRGNCCSIWPISTVSTETTGGSLKAIPL